LLILDPSEIRKKYARKMEYLAPVHDGSEDALGAGYWICNVVGTEVDGSCIVPLFWGACIRRRPLDFEAQTMRKNGGTPVMILFC